MKKTFVVCLVCIALTLMGCGSSQVKPTMSIPSPLWNSVNRNIEIYSNTGLSQDARMNALLLAADDLEVLLKLPETATLSDRLLESKLNNEIQVTKKKVSINGQDSFLRVVRLDGLPEVCGTLEREWVYLQWSDGTVKSQRIIEQGSEIPNDYIFISSNKSPSLILLGYLSLYNPHPAFAMTWQYRGGKWLPTASFGSNIKPSIAWDLNISDNEMIIEDRNRNPVTIQNKMDGNGFEVSSNEDHRIEFRVSGSKIIMTTAAEIIESNPNQKAD